MMFLTRKKAIELCLELWEWCAKTGRCKKYWPKWQEYSIYYNDTFVDSVQAIANIPIQPSDFAYCWFCLYAQQQTLQFGGILEGICSYCPIQAQFGHCTGIVNYSKWWKAGSEQLEEKKKYAAAFKEDLKIIK